MRALYDNAIFYQSYLLYSLVWVTTNANNASSTTDGTEPSTDSKLELEINLKMRTRN
jgi:hypothetical protein